MKNTLKKLPGIGFRILSFLPALNWISLLYIGLINSSTLNVICAFAYAIITFTDSSLSALMWIVGIVHYAVAYQNIKKQIIGDMGKSNSQTMTNHIHKNSSATNGFFDIVVSREQEGKQFIGNMGKFTTKTMTNPIHKNSSVANGFSDIVVSGEQEYKQFISDLLRKYTTQTMTTPIHENTSVINGFFDIVVSAEQEDKQFIGDMGKSNSQTRTNPIHKNSSVANGFSDIVISGEQEYKQFISDLLRKYTTQTMTTPIHENTSAINGFSDIVVSAEQEDKQFIGDVGKSNSQTRTNSIHKNSSVTNGFSDIVVSGEQENKQSIPLRPLYASEGIRDSVSPKSTSVANGFSDIVVYGEQEDKQSIPLRPLYASEGIKDSVSPKSTSVANGFSDIVVSAEQEDKQFIGDVGKSNSQTRTNSIHKNSSVTNGFSDIVVSGEQENKQSIPLRPLYASEGIRDSVSPKSTSVANGFSDIVVYGEPEDKQSTRVIFSTKPFIDIETEISIEVNDEENAKLVENLLKKEHGQQATQENESTKKSKVILNFENIGYQGQLHSVMIDEENAKLVENLLKKEHGQQATQENEPTKKSKVILNFENINTLRVQSDAVRTALEVKETVIPENKALLTDTQEVTEEYRQQATQENEPTKKSKIILDFENIGYQGQLRSVTIGEENAKLVENFLKKEYGQQATQENEPTKKSKVILNFENINTLRVQSDDVRTALEVKETVIPENKALLTDTQEVTEEYRQQVTQENEPTKKSKVILNFENINILRVQSDAVRTALEVKEMVIPEKKALLTDIQEVTAIYNIISPSSHSLLDRLEKSSWECNVAQGDEPLIAEINRLAERYLGCALLVAEAFKIIVEDDYRDELAYIYHNQRAPSPEESSSKLFDSSVLTPEMKEFVDALVPVQQKALNVMITSENPQSDLETIAEEAFTMPQLLLDDINALAVQIIGDIIVDTANQKPHILDEYVDLLKQSVA